MRTATIAVIVGLALVFVPIFLCGGGLLLFSMRIASEPRVHTPPAPYRIAESKLLGAPGKEYLFLQVIVPTGASDEQIKGWHKEIAARHSTQRELMINYYSGDVAKPRIGEIDADRMLFTFQGSPADPDQLVDMR